MLFVRTIMSIYHLKTTFQNILRPLCQKMANIGITANQVTLSAIFISVFWGGYISLDSAHFLSLILLPVLLFIRMALNAIDGMLAREHSMQSPLGAILNELGDVISDTVLYLPFVFIPLVNPYLIISIVIVAILTEMMGVISIQIGATRRYDGPMGKSDRAFVFGTLGLFMGLDWLTSAILINGLLAVVLLLSIITIFNRAQKALKEAA